MSDRGSVRAVGALLERVREAAAREAASATLGPLLDELDRALAGLTALLTGEAETERARVRALVEAIPLGVWIADADGRIVVSNAQSEAIWGPQPKPQRTADYVAYRRWSADSGTPLRAEDWAMARALAKGETTIGEEVEIERFDGGRRTILNNAAPIRDSQGRIVGGVVIEQDITDRKRHEADLAFLAVLGADFSDLSSAREIMAVAGERIGRYLEVDNCLFAEIDEERDTSTVEYSWWLTPELPDAVGVRWHSASVRPELRRARAGETIVIRDTQTDPRTDAASYAQLRIGAYVAVPFLREGRWRYLLTVNDSRPRDWTSNDIALIEEFTRRFFPRLERAKAEDALRTSDARVRVALNAARMAAWEYDPETKRVEISDNAREILAIPQGGRLENSDQGYAIIHPDDVQRHRSLVEQAIATGGSFVSAYRQVGDGGRVLWLEERGQAVTDATGRTVRLVGVTQNITAAKQAEDALRESEQRFALSFQYSPEALVLSRLQDGRIEDVNEAFLRLFGYERDEVLGRSSAELGMLDAEERRAAIERLQRDGEVPGLELDVRIRTGAVRRVLLSIILVPIAGTPTMLTTIHDITERTQAEEALRALNAQLEQRVEARTVELRERARLLARLATQLTTAEHKERMRLARTLHDNLQQLVVAATLQLRVLAREARHAELDQIGELRQTMEEIYDVAQSVTTELSPPVLQRGRLSEALDWLVRWVGVKHGLETHLALADGTDEVREDIKVLVFEAVRELLLNAVKHAGVDRARVSSEVRDGLVAVSVSDDGCGFDPAAAVEKDRLTGGLGLLSVRERLTLLGGGLDIESRPGGGARLTVLVPHEPVEQPAPTAAVMAPTIGPAPAGIGRRIRVLLADDHRLVRQGIATMLSLEKDIEVVGEAENGRAAVDASRRLRPDVVLMDYSMPVMDGLEATRLLHAELPQVRVVGLSMFEDQSAATAMLDAGASAYLPKSAGPEKLVDAIRDLVAR